MALVLPVTIKLGPTAGLIMLAGIYYGAMYGGSTTSILVNVPGEAASVVTTIDGYRLARRGRAGAALAVAAIASFVAGTFSVVALQVFAPAVARLALAFGPAEYFAFALLGLVLLSNLSGGSRPKALAMVVVGVMLSTVGMDPLGGTVRFTFDLGGAQAGLSFVAVAAGLFGVAEVLASAAAPGAAGRGDAGAVPRALSEPRGAAALGAAHAPRHRAGLPHRAHPRAGGHHRLVRLLRRGAAGVPPPRRAGARGPSRAWPAPRPPTTPPPAPA